jgi:aryl-alcohol dehydrogenase-like predicted oxidoreductase
LIAAAPPPHGDAPPQRGDASPPRARRPLGRSGLLVSRVGLGLAAVGRPAYITLGRGDDLPGPRTPEAMYVRTAALLDAARDAGVRYVDVARSYGCAEEFLARWLAERRVAVDELTIGSKWGYRYTAEWTIDATVHEEKELSLARFEGQLTETRALLGDRLALYQIHSATAESGVLADAALLAALVAGRRAGAYRAVGLTVTGARSARTLELALAARADGERVFDVVQATFNCLEPSLAPLLAAAHDAGLGVIVKEALANGRLAPANRRPEDAPLLARLQGLAVARAHGAGRDGHEDDGSRQAVTIDQLALAFVLAQPFVDVVLSGAATPRQLASHVAAPHVDLGAAERRALATLAETRERYWATRASLPWS